MLCQFRHRATFRGCRHSLIFKPADLLSTSIGPIIRSSGVRQPWLLCPHPSQIVTSLSMGYANRLNRKIGGRRALTLQRFVALSAAPTSPLPKPTRHRDCHCAPAALLGRLEPSGDYRPRELTLHINPVTDHIYRLLAFMSGRHPAALPLTAP